MALISYRVQTVPGRDAALDRLLSYLPEEAEVIIDDGSPAVGEWIIPPEGPWRGYIKCLTDPPDCSHLCVIQDDAVPCTNFTEVLDRVIQAQATSPICLFVPGSARQTAHQMLRLNQRFVPLAFRDFMPVVAVLWPIDLAISFLDWSRTAQLPGMPRPPQSDDAVAGAWKRTNGITVLCTNPSLVEHPDDFPSTIGRRAAGGEDKGRVAALFVNGDPLGIEWQ